MRIDAPLASGRSAYLQLHDRASYQSELASSAAIVIVEAGTIRNVRVVLDGVATKPWRATNAEAVLKDAPVIIDTFRHAASAAMEGARSYGQDSFERSRPDMVHAYGVFSTREVGEC